MSEDDGLTDDATIPSSAFCPHLFFFSVSYGEDFSFESKKMKIWICFFKSSPLFFRSHLISRQNKNYRVVRYVQVQHGQGRDRSSLSHQTAGGTHV